MYLIRGMYNIHLICDLDRHAHSTIPNAAMANHNIPSCSYSKGEKDSNNRYMAQMMVFCLFHSLQVFQDTFLSFSLCQLVWSISTIFLCFDIWLASSALFICQKRNKIQETNSFIARRLPCSMLDQHQRRNTFTAHQCNAVNPLLST